MAAVSTHFRVSLRAPGSHLVEVEATLASDRGALPETLVVFMPVWTPGSYLVREYARHVERLAADAPATVRKIRKNAWEVRAAGLETVRLRYVVYAGEASVRTSHVDASRAFLVGAALFLGVAGHEREAIGIDLELPSGWRVATPLAKAGLSAGGDGHRYEAADFDTLVDSPFEIGTHREESFRALGRLHRIAISPAAAAGAGDVERLLADTKTIVETLATFFRGELPYETYDLLLHLRSQGRGGLEHRSCAALIAAPTAFGSRDSYLDLLSLVAHEMFHAWNIKRIRPAGLVPYDYDAECYTRLLWWFEGATSYYDWRCVARAGLCSADEYLDHLAGEMAYVDDTPGRLVASLEEASYDAWIKLYRPDENSLNSSVSYYRKGEVVCALLDLELRARTGGRASLDAVLTHLWTEYGRHERPVPEDGMQRIFEQVAGVPMGDRFDAWVRGTAEIRYDATLAHVGLTFDRRARPDAPPCSLGVRLRIDAGRAFVGSVTRGSAAGRGGIDAGDEILAVAGARIEGGHLDAALRRCAPGQAVEVVVARAGALAIKNVELDPPVRDRGRLAALRDASNEAKRAFETWLGAPHSSLASLSEGAS